MYLAYSLYSTPRHAYGGCVKSLLDPNVWLSTVHAKPRVDSWRDMLGSVVVRQEFYSSQGLNVYELC
jgi:hypothetical protein